MNVCSTKIDLSTQQLFLFKQFCLQKIIYQYNEYGNGCCFIRIFLLRKLPNLASDWMADEFQS